MPHRRWTQEQIIEEIQDLYAAGERLTVRNMQRLGYAGMVAATYRNPNLGSWLAAVKAAGLADQRMSGRRRKWTRARLIAQIRQLHEQREDISYSTVKRHHPYLLVAARDPRNFGSWRAAVEAAGLDYTQIAHRRPAHGQESGAPKAN